MQTKHWGWGYCQNTTTNRYKKKSATNHDQPWWKQLLWPAHNLIIFFDNPETMFKFLFNLYDKKEAIPSAERCEIELSKLDGDDVVVEGVRDESKNNNDADELIIVDGTSLPVFEPIKFDCKGRDPINYSTRVNLTRKVQQLVILLLVHPLSLHLLLMHLHLLVDLPFMLGVTILTIVGAEVVAVMVTMVMKATMEWMNVNLHPATTTAQPRPSMSKRLFSMPGMA